MNRLSDSAKLECRICWYVYDPDIGDEIQQIPPGTPFLQLPDYWHCPECDSEADAFLPVNT